MKIVLAPNAFKGSLSATAAAAAMARGFRRVMPDAELLAAPVSDGGDGLVDVLAEIMGGRIVSAEVSDPLGRKVSAEFALVDVGRTAVIEMATASGLALLKEDERNPMAASTMGTGELIRHAAASGVRKIILGIGGSATCDGGVGAAAALGWKFLDPDGNDLVPCGATLRSIRAIKAPEGTGPAHGISFEIVCDVENPLLGPDGAARVYAPQKGASPADVEELEMGLANLAAVIKKQLGTDVASIKGGGAAGGMGAGMAAFFNAKLRRGAELVLDLIDLSDKLKGADLIVTGEGRIDSQTVFGKAPAEVAKFAKARGVPCIAVCGARTGALGQLHNAGCHAIFSICPGPCTLEHASANAAELLADACAQIAGLVSALRNMGCRKGKGKSTLRRPTVF